MFVPLFLASPVRAGDWEDYRAAHPKESPCDAHVRTALLSTDKGENEKALKSFAGAEKGGCLAEDGLALAKAAFLNRLEGDSARAKELYEKALPLLEKDYPTHSVRVGALYNLAYLIESEGRYDEAASRYEEALKIDPAFQNARTSLKSLHVKLCRSKLKEKKGKDALSHAEQALLLQEELDKGLTEKNEDARREVLLLLVRAYDMSGAPEKAKNITKEIIPLADARTAEEVGAFWADPSREGFDLAEEALKKAASLDTKRTAPLTQLAGLYESKEKWLEAAKAYEDASKRKPKDPDLVYAMGYALFQGGDKKKAKEAFGKVLSLDPSHSDARDALSQF
ncbi:MAG: tetratricopeptide repeat protein [Bdellovibrionota bacterium]